MTTRTLGTYVALGVFLFAVYHYQTTEATPITKRTFLPYHRLNLKISPKFIDYIENALNERQKHSTLKNWQKRSKISDDNYNRILSSPLNDPFDGFSFFV
ncbi:hypothetical protein Tcan_14515 [Toxocara canis]|uniref:Uncharacterized protein n=1 Tax=Toxocara canis TaxID=6265 RepID=A0A0B2V1B0_TOXCA|nr:hypothetical protein Tcan_14515 [Toxocara canis]